MYTYFRPASRPVSLAPLQLLEVQPASSALKGAAALLLSLMVSVQARTVVFSAWMTLIVGSILSAQTRLSVILVPTSVCLLSHSLLELVAVARCSITEVRLTLATAQDTVLLMI